MFTSLSCGANACRIKVGGLACPLVDPLAIILVATAAVCHAVWNLYAKRAADGGSVFVWLNSCVTTVAYLPVVVFLVVTSPPAWTWTLLIAVIVTGILHLDTRSFFSADINTATCPWSIHLPEAPAPPCR